MKPQSAEMPKGARVSPRVASELTGFPEAELVAFASRGEIRSERINGNWRVDLDDADRLALRDDRRAYESQNKTGRRVYGATARLIKQFAYFIRHHKRDTHESYPFGRRSSRRTPRRRFALRSNRLDNSTSIDE